MLTAIAGVNWGDEGKGRMVDLLSKDYDVVVRYQGGNNAGHTVINERGKFVLNLLPSGILRPDVVCVMGNGMAIDFDHLEREIANLREKGIEVSPDNLKISDRASVVLPYHVLQDCLEEERLGSAKYGSTRRGIAPVYGDKYLKKVLRAGDLLFPGYIGKRLPGIVEWKNLTIKNGYGAEPLDPDELVERVREIGRKFGDYVCDTGLWLEKAAAEGKNVLFEAQLGALRDIDFGIYPFTTSSNTLAAYAPIGAGIPHMKLDKTIGVMKAYSSCVGEGPFTVEGSGAFADGLRKAGNEYGAATGRPRRVGAFDAVACRYGIRMQGCDEIALTKMDVLGYMEVIPVCTAYEIDGKTTKDFPYGEALDRARPVFEIVKGWESDIGGCRKPGDLPPEAVKYIRFIEDAVGMKIRYVSVGADRDELVEMY